MKQNLEDATQLALEGKLTENSDIPMYLDEIYELIGVKDTFDKYGHLTDAGVKAEKKLFNILSGLDHLGIIDFDEDRFDEIIDEIVNE